MLTLFFFISLNGVSASWVTTDRYHSLVVVVLHTPLPSLSHEGVLMFLVAFSRDKYACK